MLNKNRLVIIPVVIVFTAGIIMSSCKHIPESTPCENTLPETVSFKNNILPLFDAYCNTSGCHSGGSPKGNLNLEDSVAYASLMKPGSGYINTSVPNFSGLYVQMNSTNLPMPPAGLLDECKRNLVLRWIQQGASNN